MNTYNPQASFAPFIPEGLSIPQYGYGGAYPAPHRQQYTHRNGHPPRPEGHAAPHVPYPPLFVPVYPFGLAAAPHPVGYPGVFPPNYPMYPAPNENPIQSPIRSSASSHQSNPPFLPPQATRSSGSHHYHPGSHHYHPGSHHYHPGSHHYHPGSHHYHPGSAYTSTSSRTTSDRSHSDGYQWIPPPPPSHKSIPTFQPQPTPTTTRITGRYGIHELLNSQLDSHPYLDWVIHNDLSLARQWVIGNSGTERCQSVGFEGLAVVPPVNNLSIRTTTTSRGRQHTPVGQALHRWGDIRVCRFDRFLSVGDVLHEIWAYFDAPLTEDEKATMHPPFSRRVEMSFQRRWNAQGKLPDQAVKRRCDTLLDCVRFAGLEIGLDFETCKELYLSLEDAN